MSLDSKVINSKSLKNFYFYSIVMNSKILKTFFTFTQ